MTKKGPLVGLTMVHKILFVSCTRRARNRGIAYFYAVEASPHNRVKRNWKMQLVTRSMEAQPRSSQRILKMSTLASTHLSLKDYNGCHLVYGSPTTQIPVNHKARHPTPVIILSQMNEPRFGAVLTHLIIEKPAQRRLPPEFSKSSAPKDTHFVSWVTLSAKYYKKIASEKSKNQMVQVVYPAEGLPNRLID